MKTLIQQFKNAMAIIRQMKAEEWEFEGHYKYEFKAQFTCFTAKRKGIELWVANGPMFCHISDKDWELGPFGWLVWYGGAGKRKKALEKKMRLRPSDLTA
ncbi:hypothetical protein KO537_09330 [Shewanella sp. NKUCC01_JLK]|uniref:hypothetical protein n=1 Tax=Shewanella sp. NKUCC01_JLK TaxID=2842123 RepID=UPI001C5B9F46|nr:hypothetical protein [Shewanella sp. NKUCC01_JLK]MBW3514923.1 hypothetical protein [Shewanella sp. NKUCC01_JLK]